LRRSSNAVVGPWVAASLLAAALAASVPVVRAAETAGTDEAAVAAEQTWQEMGRRPGDGEQCLVCSLPIEGETAVEIRYKGRVFYVKESMLDAFRADPDAYFRKLQARSGLFDEAAMAGPPMPGGWFFAGVYVAVGLVFGALCASLALGRGRRPLPWLVAGLVGNVVALAVLLLRPSAADGPAARAGTDPSGRSGRLGALGRVSATRDPRACPACGAPNHPAAAACSSCGASLEPLTRSETELTGLAGIGEAP
jgi:hypothetical protein